MFKVKLSHIMMDSKIHILAISTLLCMKIMNMLFAHSAMLHIMILYSLLAMWIIVDYKIGLAIRNSIGVWWAYAIPTVVVCLLRYLLYGDSWSMACLRLVILTVVIVWLYNIFSLRSSKVLGLVIAVVIEILVPLKDQEITFIMILAGSLIGIVSTLLVTFVYYSLVDYSAYKKYAKKAHNEERICAILEEQVKCFILGEAVDWDKLKAEIVEFKENRFFYNRQKVCGSHAELFYNMVLELYCILKMLKGFSKFDSDTLEEAEKVFSGCAFNKAYSDDALYYCENISVRSMLFNLSVLRDMIANRVNSYILKM